MVEVVYISWREAIDLCYRLGTNIVSSGYEPDTIIAILRGGVIPALILSDMLGIEEFYAIRVKHWGVAQEIHSAPIIEQLPQKRLQNSKVLLVDEVVDTGKTLAKAVEEIKKLGALEIKTAALHLKSSSAITPDYCVVKLDKWVWIFYPWSLAETLFALAYKEIGNLVNREAVLKKIEEIAISLNIEYYRRDVIESALRFYPKKKFS